MDRKSEKTQRAGCGDPGNRALYRRRHTASGYWVNTGRETTVNGLYAAGDVAGGCPQKYVTGALQKASLQHGYRETVCDGISERSDIRQSGDQSQAQKILSRRTKSSVMR